jgi:RNA polymerase sigma-70 factor (ECF subfamily)
MLRPSDDPTALAGRLYDQYGASLFRYAVMILADRSAAEDAVQQVFAALLKRDRSAIDNDAHYLRRAVRNECYSILRRPRLVDVAAPLLEPVAEPERPDERLALERAMRELSPDQREVVHLHAYEGRTFQEIADDQGESINTVASRYRYALDKLRKLLS